MFQYKAVSTTGETLHGDIHATDHDEAIIKLQRQGYIPISATEAKHFTLDRLLQSRHHVSQRQISIITQQLATMLSAGLPLDQALQLLIGLADDQALKKRLQTVLEQVKGGASLSTALEKQANMFSRLYINMIRAGEIGGTLANTLQRLDDYLSRSQALKSSIVSALIYPVLLLLMAAGSLIILLIYVVPEFTPMFAELGGELPMFTRAVLAAGGVLQHYWWALMLGAGGLFFFMQQQLSHARTRYRWDRWLLRCKWLGDLVSKIEMARFARTFGTLLVNGVSVLRALSIASQVMTNSVLAEDVKRIASEVKTGEALAASLGNSQYFPKMAIQMVRVGEETGQLDNMLLRIADTYDVEVKTAIDRLLALMVPILTVVLAVVIAGIVMSILMAILSINDLFI